MYRIIPIMYQDFQFLTHKRCLRCSADDFRGALPHAAWLVSFDDSLGRLIFWLKSKNQNILCGLVAINPKIISWTMLKTFTAHWASHQCSPLPCHHHQPSRNRRPFSRFWTRTACGELSYTRAERQCRPRPVIRFSQWKWCRQADHTAYLKRHSFS